MRTLLSICAGIALISGILSFNLWHELRAEQQLTADLRKQVDDEKLANRLLTTAAQRVNAAIPATETTGKANVAPVATPATAGNPANAQNIVNLEQAFMRDPEYRKLRLAQIRTNIERNYPGLAEELGLSEQEARKLYDLLAENQLAMNLDSLIPGVNGTQDQAALQQMTQRLQAQQREQEAAIRNLLGESKYAQWQDYQQTSPARQRVTSMNVQLAQAGVPLSESQSRALTTVMLAEQQRQRQDQQAMARAFSGNQNDPNFRAQMQEEAMKRTEESNRRVLDAAAPHVNPKQLDALREQLEQQVAMGRISSRVQMEQDRLQQ